MTNPKPNGLKLVAVFTGPYGEQTFTVHRVNNGSLVVPPMRQKHGWRREAAEAVFALLSAGHEALEGGAEPAQVKERSAQRWHAWADDVGDWMVGSEPASVRSVVAHFTSEWWGEPQHSAEQLRDRLNEMEGGEA